MNRYLLHLAAITLPTIACACSPAVSGAASGSPAVSEGAGPVHAESGLPVVPLVVKGRGHAHSFKVEVARSRAEQMKGLMFRTALGPDEGMLFPFEKAREASFWMKNTVIPLDIIFIGPDHRILNIEADATPYSEDPRNSRGEAAAVLELNGGRAKQLGIGPGDKVEYPAAKRLAPMSAAE